MPRRTLLSSNSIIKLMSEITKQFKKQLPRNAIAAVFTFITHAVTVAFLTPYLVSHLGVAAYGLVPLAGVLTQYASVIANCLGTAVTRFISVELNKDGGGSPQVVFNSALFLFVTIAFMQGAIFAFVLHNASAIFSIPQEVFDDALILLICSSISFCLNFVCSVFNVSTFAKNRIDLSSHIRAVALLLRIVLVVSLFSLLGPTLRYVGYAELIVALFQFSGGVYFWQKLTPELSLSLRSIDIKRLKPILQMSGWVLVSQLGFLLNVRSDVWIANRFISPEAGGMYAAVLQCSYFIRQVCNVAFALTGPMFITYYAVNDTQKIQILCQRVVRYASCTIAVPVAVLCAFSPELLSLWLGTDFVPLWPLLVVMTSHLFLSLSVFPFFQIQNAANKVRIPGIATLLFGFLNVVLSLLLVRDCGFGMMGLAVTGALILLLKNVGFMIWYTGRFQGIDLRPVYGGLGRALSVFIVVVLLGRGMKQVVPISTPFMLVCCVATGLLGMWITWMFFSRAEKQFVYTLIPEKYGILKNMSISDSK